MYLHFIFILVLLHLLRFVTFICCVHVVKFLIFFLNNVFISEFLAFSFYVSMII